ncbi:PIG-L family deacetylase [Microbacterium sp. zg.B48]|uniref:PIG-L deacetylase family protein n=1 Tax=Microbacterium sp. zg.B48 TaxID=2969408 RepID=UPI00214BB6D1|nr:PIG-L family deacetylase [Microbacterium sp. zg.B48]MCR2765182.1 PIG-L family deacetylase [Microbacterium sp. zg.B48]
MGATLGWSIGILAVGLFGLAGAAVASGQVGQLLGGASPTPSLTPSPSATPTPSVTPTPTPPPAPPAPPAPAVPVSPADTACATAVTMSIWAHYDDDLIFGNPTLQDAITGGDCIRSVFLTASDAGRGTDYSKGRELGILRAYNTMRGQQGFWAERPVTLLSGAVLSQWSPEDDPDITVAFLRLPDGNVSGDGFASTGYASLPKLLSGVLPVLAPIYGAPPLSSETLVASLAELVLAYHPAHLLTHVPADAAMHAAGDHPDHGATGIYARAAWQRAGFPAGEVRYAVGYPSESFTINVTGDTLIRKIDAFRVYAAQDSVVTCATDAACLAMPRFGAWLQRSYLATDAELFPAG